MKKRTVDVVPQEFVILILMLDGKVKSEYYKGGKCRIFVESRMFIVIL